MARNFLESLAFIKLPSVKIPLFILLCTSQIWLHRVWRGHFAATVVYTWAYTPPHTGRRRHVVICLIRLP
jgi:hypothetical protein